MNFASSTRTAENKVKSVVAKSSAKATLQGYWVEKNRGYEYINVLDHPNCRQVQIN